MHSRGWVGVLVECPRTERRYAAPSAKPADEILEAQVAALGQFERGRGVGLGAEPLEEAALFGRWSPGQEDSCKEGRR